jgi:hypothetical protein
MHLKIAEEIEHRSRNRLTEVAEALAHHYSQTNKVDKAFNYFSMSGSKSLSVYSLDGSVNHFAAALALDENPDCALDDQVAEFLVSYTLLLNMSRKLNVMIDVLERYMPRINRLGDDPRAVLIRHQYVFALVWSARYGEAAVVQRYTSPMADRLGDNKSKAYSLAGEIHVSTIIAPKPLHEFEKLKRETIKAASDTGDAYIQNWSRFVIGFEEIHRGRMTAARDTAHELMQVGRLLGDPRSTGLGLALLAWIAQISDSYVEALEYTEQSLAVAVTRSDRILANASKAAALLLLRQTDEGANLLEEEYRRSVADGDLLSLAVDGWIMAVCTREGRLSRPCGLVSVCLE